MQGRISAGSRLGRGQEGEDLMTAATRGYSAPFPAHSLPLTLLVLTPAKDLAKVKGDTLIARKPTEK